MAKFLPRLISAIVLILYGYNLIANLDYSPMIVEEVDGTPYFPTREIELWTVPLEVNTTVTL